jgi:prepilin-type N-terminal cleavage/methylation domain-containing protein
MQLRRAVSLVEMLVVIAVIAILIALLLPAIQQAREAGRRVSCANHLKQLGLAVHQFHDTQGTLPQSRIWDHWAPWTVLLLPFLEQEPLYDQWDLQQQYYAQTVAVREAHVPLFLCPSRRSGLHLSAEKPDTGGDAVRGAVGDYAANAGDRRSYPQSVPPWYDTWNNSGVFGVSRWRAERGSRITQWTAPYSLASITDGTSHTVLIGEKHVPRQRLLVAPGDGPMWSGDHERNFARLGGQGLGLARDSGDLANWYWRFGSWHPGVCQFVYADGSVRPMSVSIEEVALGRHTQKADGGDGALAFESR